MHCLREEIRRIKANNPDISHREAFSTAAKNKYMVYIEQVLSYTQDNYPMKIN
jgi:hypothetical protein